MLEKFLGFLWLITMAMCGFWLMSFLISFVPTWLIGQSGERFNKLNKGKKVNDYQEPLEVIYKKEDELNNS